MKPRDLVLPLAFIAAATACGATSDGQGGADSGQAGAGGGTADAGAGVEAGTDAGLPKEVEIFRKSLLDAAPELCKAAEQCCIKEWGGFDQSACVDTVGRAWNLSLLVNELVERAKDPAVKFDEAALLACWKKMAAHAAACDPESEQPDCIDAAFPGTVQPGGSCTKDSQCAPPASSGPIDVRCNWNGTGVCSQFSAVGLGDPCDRTCFDSTMGGCFTGKFPKVPHQFKACLLSEDLHCGLSSTCEPRGKLGEPCEMRTCQPDGHCSISAICEPRKPIGASCPDFPYGEEVCQAGLYCKGYVSGQTGSGKCAPALSLGAQCSLDAECISDFCQAGWCAPPPEPKLLDADVCGVP